MSKHVMFKGQKIAKGSELAGYVESGDEKKASALLKKLDAEMIARGENLPDHLRNYAIGRAGQE